MKHWFSLVFLYRKAKRLRRAVDEKIISRMETAEGKTPHFRWLETKAFFLGAWEGILRFFIMLSYTPAESFEIFYKTHEGKAYPVSFIRFKKIHSQVRVFSKAGGATIIVTSILVGLSLNILTGVYKSASAATFAWTQTTWTTLTSNTTGHTDENRNTWTEYTTADTDITVGDDVTLTLVASSTTQTVPYFYN